MPVNPDRAEVERLAILGPGTLGLALAALAAERGLNVRLAGRDVLHAETGVAKVFARWQRHQERGRITAESAAMARTRLFASGSVEEALDDACAVLESLPEDLETKRAAWTRIAAAAASSTLLLTGSSSLPIAGIRRGIALKRRLIGFHLFLPLERMDALELVAEEGTDPFDLARVRSLGTRLGRRIFQVRDGTGYAASRMALAQGLEAMRLLERGVAAAQDLDGLMVHGYGHPVGPLELSDRIGLDLRLDIARGLHAATGEPAFAPPAILEELVRRGACGRKSGQGFYAWDGEGRRR